MKIARLPGLHYISNNNNVLATWQLAYWQEAKGVERDSRVTVVNWRVVSCCVCRQLLTEGWSPYLLLSLMGEVVHKIIQNSILCINTV